jgi:hypothetical protein
MLHLHPHLISVGGDLDPAVLVGAQKVIAPYRIQVLGGAEYGTTGLQISLACTLQCQAQLIIYLT